MSAIVVRQVGKAYKRYASQWARAREWLFRIHSHEQRWVLQDVNFEVDAGAAVGILGANGAGKSTLLKIIARATTPTSGSAVVAGRVAALLELGMGFHPEFTGRQNALMAGQLLGAELAELDLAMPDIERFADIGDFMDQPLRTYSSGMQMRLAFSVATATRPDVLIIDEALSVGDAAFQRKCYQRIESFREQGTTLLFVSHDIEAVKRLCDQALFLAQGKVMSQGPVRGVCDAYEKALFGARRREAPVLGAASTSADQKRISHAYDPAIAPTCEQIYGTGEAVIESCWLEALDGEPVNVVNAGEPVRWCFVVHFKESVVAPIFSMMLKTREGEAVYGTDSVFLDETAIDVSADTTLKVVFHIETALAPDQYFLNCGVRHEQGGESVFLSRRVDAAILQVSGSQKSTAVVGPADLGARLAVSPMEYPNG
ncbi:ABC transporter ATP-binding protein [bacterium]|nr:ABC transporter ATP-binding protein [bacterium]